MKSTKIPASPKDVRKQLGWTCKQWFAAVGIFPVSPTDDRLQRLARIAPYLKMYRSNPDWNL